MPTGLEAVAWAREVERLGAGEIVLTSMDADGTKNGYDLEMTPRGGRGRGDPGGCQRRSRAARALAGARWPGGADAALAASIFHYREYTIAADQGIPGTSTACRCGWSSRVARPRDHRPRFPRSPTGGGDDFTSQPQPTLPTDRTSPSPESSSSFRLASRGVRAMSTAVEASLETITNEPEANKLFRMVMKYKGSDLHLKVGCPPVDAAGRRLAADAAAGPLDAPRKWSG